MMSEKSIPQIQELGPFPQAPHCRSEHAGPPPQAAQGRVPGLRLAACSNPAESSPLSDSGKILSAIGEKKTSAGTRYTGKPKGCLEAGREPSAWPEVSGQPLGGNERHCRGGTAGTQVLLLNELCFHTDYQASTMLMQLRHCGCQVTTEVLCAAPVKEEVAKSGCGRRSHAPNRPPRVLTPTPLPGASAQRPGKAVPTGARPAP